ncbi:hypothetical protein AB0M44_15845 [Streptosporangium subroseum]|uniref:hypothetical protein n=1 Tax=Streptosporangium subroseum TaxID=106412 RepID=UPI0034484FDA
MSIELDTRLFQLRNELDDHSRVARHLGLDFERPIKSLGDGYPENAIALFGKIAERILKQLWRHRNRHRRPRRQSPEQADQGCAAVHP